MKTKKSIKKYIYSLFYSQLQILPINSCHIKVKTPSKYCNDCLHPCIRYFEEKLFGYSYWMVQSPVPSHNNKLENPILYRSNNIFDIGNYGVVLRDTPDGFGYNSDPCLFRDGNRLYVFWREVESAYCISKGQMIIVRGIYTDDGDVFSKPIDYLYNDNLNEDYVQCPILMKHGNEYIFYAVHYQYKKIRKNKGISIWRGTSLQIPNFKLENIEIKNPITLCKWKQKWIKQILFFIPRLCFFDLWHFDLFEYNNKLYMVCCEENRNNLLLAVSEDWKHFKFKFIPLILNTILETTCLYRQYYYKPTAFVKNKKMHFFYTTNSKDGEKNFLMYNTCEMTKITI